MSSSEKRRRDAVIPRIRCTQNEKFEIVKKAEECGLTVPEYMRRCALNQKITAHIDRASLLELRRLGGLQKHLFIEGGRTGDKAYAGVLIAITELSQALRDQLKK